MKGENITIRNNTMEKCIGGQSMHPWNGDNSFPKNCNIHDNDIEGTYGGFLGSGTNILVYNNTISGTGTGSVLEPL